MAWYYIVLLIIAGIAVWLLLSSLFYRQFFKRFYDIVLSGLALVVLSPVLLITAILVRIKLGTPVLFKQERPGKDGKIFNGNKIITGSAGGMFLTDSKEDADKVRKWSTQSREAAPWYQHEEIGYNYRMSNIIAGVIRGQIPYLDEHIAQKKAIYERYEEGLKCLPVRMNPWNREKSVPNFWLSCMIIDEDAMAPSVRGEQDYLYKQEKGKSSPHEILDAIASLNAEGRPIWKPMHMQPIYRTHAFITAEGNGRGRSNAYIDGKGADVGADIFRRGLCLPSDNKMTAEQQGRVIEVIRRCFE